MMDSSFTYISEFLCYFGASLSMHLAWKLWRMESLTYFNKLCLLYFFLDSILGTLETYFLFKLYRER